MKVFIYNWLLAVIPLVIIAMLYSCRGAKEVSRVESDRHTAATVSEYMQDFRVGMMRDSSYRFWSFNSDSAWRYHPDSGLWAFGGKLRVHESIRRDRSLFSFNNRGSMNEKMESQSDLQMVSIIKNKNWKWIVIAILTVGVLLWICKKIG